MRPLSSFENVGSTLLKALPQIPYKYWISAGTALGLYRDRDFIPNDTDIDIEIWVPKNHEIQINALEGFKEYRFVNYQGQAMQRAFEDSDNGVIFDIYFMHERDEDLWNLCDFGDYVLPKKFFENLETIKTKYGKLPFPSPIEDYLAFRYGPDWKTPKQAKGIYNNTY